MIPRWFDSPYSSLTGREQQEVAEYLEYRHSTVQSEREAYMGELDRLHAELVEEQLKKRKGYAKHADSDTCN